MYLGKSLKIKTACGAVKKVVMCVVFMPRTVYIHLHIVRTYTSLAFTHSFQVDDCFWLPRCFGCHGVLAATILVATITIPAEMWLSRSDCGQSVAQPAIKRYSKTFFGVQQPRHCAPTETLPSHALLVCMNLHLQNLSHFVMRLSK